MSRLITASLVGAIDWLNKSPPTWKERAWKQLTNQLARDYSEPPGPALELGIEFESAVYAHASKSSDQGSDAFKWFVEQCRGGVVQKKVKQYMTLDGVEYCLYCKLDVWFPNVIKDIKTTSNYKGDDYYLASFQHQLYCHVAGIDDFEYLVAVFDGGDPSNKRIVDKHQIKYHVSDRGATALYVVRRVKETVEFLKAHEELYKLYTTKFSMY